MLQQKMEDVRNELQLKVCSNTALDIYYIEDVQNDHSVDDSIIIMITDITDYKPHREDCNISS